MKIVFRPVVEVAQFLKRHWVHILLCIPGAILVTLVHETAHAVAAWLQGGIIVDFVWLPHGELWGYVNYIVTPEKTFSETTVSLAPYIFWTALALLASGWSLRKPPDAFWKSSTIFVWLFAIPLGDVAYAVLPYLMGKENDIYRVFYTPSYLTISCIFLGTIAFSALGFFVQRRLYKELALSFWAYLILIFACLLGITFGGSWLFKLMAW